MLVVADVSPFIALAQLSKLDLLPTLFGEVVIPPDVLAELGAPNRPLPIQALASSLPHWVIVRVPTERICVPGLHAGETAAIQLASELNADMLLIDEIKGRKVAIQRGLRITGTVGILETAALNGMLDLRDILAQLKRTDFWVSQKLIDNELRRYDEKQEEQ